MLVISNALPIRVVPTILPKLAVIEPLILEVDVIFPETVVDEPLDCIFTIC